VPGIQFVRQSVTSAAWLHCTSAIVLDLLPTPVTSAVPLPRSTAGAWFDIRQQQSMRFSWERAWGSCPRCNGRFATVVLSYH
jgi:hypothetical protein